MGPMGNVAHRVLTMRRQRKVAKIFDGWMSGLVAALPVADDWRCRAARARERPPFDLLRSSSMSIQRFEIGPRMSQVVVHGDTVYLAGVVAQKAAGESVTKQ